MGSEKEEEGRREGRWEGWGGKVGGEGRGGKGREGEGREGGGEGEREGGWHHLVFWQPCF